MKYSTNIVTETKPLPKEIVERFMQKPIRSTVKSTRLLYLDDEVVKGAFYLECVWMHEGTSQDPIEEPHTHDFDEIIGFVGSDPKNPSDLGAEIDISLEDEQFVLKKSCLVFIPKGLRHCPILFRKIDRPIIWFTLGPIKLYKREWVESMVQSKTSSKPSTVNLSKYIIAEMKKDLAFPKEVPPNVPKLTRFLYLDDTILKGALYMECVWFTEGVGMGGPEPHYHDFDEVLAFMGSDPKNPRALGGEIELWLSDEKHILRNSCLVFIPKGLRHCPLIFRRMDKPIFHFSTGNKGLYEKKVKE